ncbi:MAG TPA: sulfurtransferase [Candidatus Binataceae bacterium]|nr:sulfurtransferase [Candidatus Binataceae bacterium]
MAVNPRPARYLVDARWLREHRGDKNIVLIDTRPADEYWAGHLRGARHFDPFPFHYYDTSERGMAEFRSQLEWIFSALGITGKETVVFYENDSGMRTTRGAWALEHLGHPRARALDGGLKLASAEPLTAKPPSFAPARFRAKARDETAASFAYVLERIGRPGAQIFDVRSDEEYYGERIRAKRGGAIPGAIHRDWTAANTDAGEFKPPKELRAEFEALGLNPDSEIIPYCQGGYRAAHAYIALKLAGYPRVRNYFGSWAEWGNRDDLPIDHPARPG